MISEELEFRIARYADGDLTPEERQGVEVELANDDDARALLAEYQTLRSAIEEAAGPALPKVHWDRLEQLLSTAVAQSAGPGRSDKIVAEDINGEAESSADGSGGVTGATGVDGPFVGMLGVEDEFAIACFADGTILPERQAEVGRLVVTDTRANALLNEYQSLDATIKSLAYRLPAPAIRREKLAAYIRRAVDIGAQTVLEEDWERQIAEFASMELLGFEGTAVERRLAKDPAARVSAYEYANLNTMLGSLRTSQPVPAVNWVSFATFISAALNRQAVQTTVRSHRSGDSGAYSILKWLRSPTWMALAASVVVCVALVGKLIHGGHVALPTPQPIAVANPGPRVEEIAVLQPVTSAGTPASDVSIGPPQVAHVDGDDGYAVGTGDDDNVVSRPPRAFVASGRGTSSDAEVLPAMPY